MSEIIHWGIMKFGTKYYICNQAVKASEKKITDYHYKVTCKNCLQILKDEIKPKEGNIETPEESNDRYLYRKQIASDYSPKGDGGRYS